MAGIISYPDPQVRLLPLFPTLTLSPLLSQAAAFKMAPLVAMVAVLVTCRAGLVKGVVAMASTVSAGCGAWPGVGSLGPWVTVSLACLCGVAN